MSTIILPEFCTVVSPDEYDYIAQYNEAVKAANKFHKKIQEECPPPYFPFDMGKICGLVQEVERLKKELGGTQNK